MASNNKKPKIIVILGQTATGKSDLGVQLAKKFRGEVISADSRQVYKGLDIGTGKITKKEMRGIPHHLLDVVSPKRQFSVAEYKKKAEHAIDGILSRGKIPILVGGTGFYIQAVVDGIVPPEVAPDPELRKKLEKKSPESLLKMLKKLDPERALTIEQKNPRRLIRAIEIARTLGKVPNLEVEPPNFEVLQIGPKVDDKKLKERISKRLFTRISGGMVKEAKKLHEKGLSWKRMEELGFDQKYVAQYLERKISKDEMTEKLIRGNIQYAKRQKTWFKRDSRIHWFKPAETKKIEKLVQEFLK